MYHLMLLWCSQVELLEQADCTSRVPTVGPMDAPSHVMSPPPHEMPEPNVLSAVEMMV